MEKALNLPEIPRSHFSKTYPTTIRCVCVYATSLYSEFLSAVKCAANTLLIAKFNQEVFWIYDLSVHNHEKTVGVHQAKIQIMLYLTWVCVGCSKNFQLFSKSVSNIC